MDHTCIRFTLHPGQDGARGWQAEYGDRLVCVRYRYDECRHKRDKTVELILAEEPWTPAVPASAQLVAVRVAAMEKRLRQQGKRAGGQWDAQRGVWQLR